MPFIKAKLTIFWEEILRSFIRSESNTVQRRLAANYTFFLFLRGQGYQVIRKPWTTLSLHSFEGEK